MNRDKLNLIENRKIKFSKGKFYNFCNELEKININYKNTNINLLNLLLTEHWDDIEYILNKVPNPFLFFLSDNKKMAKIEYFFQKKEFLDNFEFFWAEFMFFLRKSRFAVLYVRSKFSDSFDFNGKLPLIELFRWKFVQKNYNNIKDDLAKIIDIVEYSGVNFFVTEFKILDNVPDFENYWADFVKIISIHKKTSVELVRIFNLLIEKYYDGNDFHHIWIELKKFSNFIIKNKIPYVNLNQVINHILNENKEFSNLPLSEFIDFISSFDFTFYMQNSIKNFSKLFIKYYNFDKNNIDKLNYLVALLQRNKFDVEIFSLDYIENIEIVDYKLIMIATNILKYTDIYPNPDLIMEFNNENVIPNKKILKNFLSKKTDLIKNTIIYTQIRKKIDPINNNSTSKKIQNNISYFDFRNNNYRKKNPLSQDEVINRYLPTMYWASLEILRVENFIKLFREKSNREILIVSNLRLGLFYSKPLEPSFSNDKKIKFIYTKVGSTMFHQTMSYVYNIFDENTIKYILKKKPNVVIIDSSVFGKLPDAFKGFITFFNKINQETDANSDLWKILFDRSEHGREKLNENYEPNHSSGIFFKNFIKRFKLLNKDLYQPYILTHPMNNNISLTQNQNNFFSINDSDIQTIEYTTNIVSNDFFNDKNLSLPQLYLLNVAFPFEKLDNIDILKEISGHEFSDIKTKKNEKYVFDDQEEILGQNLVINDDGISVDNDFLIEKLIQIYIHVKERFSK